MKLNRRAFLTKVGVAGAIVASGIITKNGSLVRADSRTAEPPKTLAEPTYKKYIVGEIPRYDAKNNAFSRMTYDPEYFKIRALQMKNMQSVVGGDKENFVEMALRGGSWATAYFDGNVSGVYSWGGGGMLGWKKYGRLPFSTAGMRKLDAKDIEFNTGWVKKAALTYGADLVGVCEVNPTWIYSQVYNIITKKSWKVEIPPSLKYAVVMAIELPHELISQSPRPIAAAATGLDYSRMIEVSAKMAEFIRNLGYEAIPMGNDTALSVPLAIDAGLGELGRLGVLITAKYGPRVRLCKVFTDLPLMTDKPVDLGQQDFCESCGNCAAECPTGAIPGGERTEVRGLRRWAADPVKCFQGWAARGVDCTHCISVCPKSEPRTA